MTGDEGQADDMPAPVPTVAEFTTKIRSYWSMTLPEPPPPGELGDLEQILASHRKWVESVGNPAAPIVGTRACLSGCDLRGVNLARRDLRGADLSRANLEGAILQGSQLMLADLTGANLRNADLRGAKMRLADLTGASLEGADMLGAQTE